MDYRREIDGLRALAVVPVVLYHTGLGWLPGGYLGVDVFFVISGYLITSIVRDQLAAGTFSLGQFYLRRARRILPALLLVMIASLPLAFMTMLPHDLQSFGQSLVATTGFANNILLLASVGYFDLPNALKPLVHTWSLGIEEQFYVVYPLLLLALARRPQWTRWAPSITIGLLLIASLGFERGICGFAPEAAYLLLPTRLWELASGALVALLRADAWGRRWPGSIGSVIGLTGLGAMLTAFVLGGDVMPCASPYPILATSGTALVIVAAHKTTIPARLLIWSPLAGLGLVSYSLYLWHQPLLAFLRLASPQPPSTWIILATVLLALGLACASWRWVEQPLRRRRISSRRFVSWTVLISASLAGLGLVLHVTGGLESRWPDLPPDLTAAGRKANATYNFAPRRFTDADFGTGARRKVLVLGDSFARDVVNAGLESGYLDPASVSYTNRGLACLASADAIEPELRRRIGEADLVILGSPTALDATCWATDAALLRGAGAKRLVVVGTKDFGEHYARVMRLSPAQRATYRASPASTDIALNTALASLLPAGTFVDPLRLLSDADGRVPLFTPDGRLISHDRRHLTPAGARFLGEKMFADQVFAVP